MTDAQNGNQLYSDGEETELAILEIARRFPEDLSQDYIADKHNYLLDHTFSATRRNILNWYPFRRDSELLEIGAGLGPLTGTFCDSCKHVTAVEMSGRRADVIRARYSGRENLTVVVDDIRYWRTEKKFDYVVLVGVLEYAGVFSNEADPFTGLLALARSFLCENGTALVAIENRFGLKYWCGAGEDHVHTPFSGIHGYPSAKSPKTFSKTGLKRMLLKAGFADTRFYYPLPDYKFPQKIYSDDYLPYHGDLKQLAFTYHRFSLLTADEKELYGEIVDNGVFDFFANSFLIEAGNSRLPEDHIIYVSTKGKVKKPYRITATIDSDGTVIKYPGDACAVPQLKAIFSNNKYLLKRGINMVEASFEGERLVSRLNEGVRADKEFIRYLIADDINGLKIMIDKLRKCILQSSECSQKRENILTAAGLCDSDCDFGVVLSRGFIDMIFHNCFCVDDELVFFNQRMALADVPLKLMLYRAVSAAYFAVYTKNGAALEELLSFIDVSPEEKIAFDRFLGCVHSDIFLSETDYSAEDAFVPFNYALTLENRLQTLQKRLQKNETEKQRASKLFDNERRYYQGEIQTLRRQLKEKSEGLEP